MSPSRRALGPTLLLASALLAGCPEDGPGDGPEGPTLEGDPPATRFALTWYGVPTILDDEELEPHEVWDGTLPLAREPTLSGDGRMVTFSADGGGSNDVYAGVLGEAEIIASSDLYAYDPRFNTAGDQVVWIDQGTNTPWTNTIRITGVDGEPGAADEQGGFTQAWGPRFHLDDEAIVVINGSSDDMGPLWHLDATTGELTQWTTEEVQHPFDVHADGRVAGGYAYWLVVADPAAGTEEIVFSFPWEEPECVVGEVEPGSLCFFTVSLPRFSRDGTRIVFVGRGHPVMNPDGTDGLFVFDLDEGEVTRVTGDDLFNWEPLFGAAGEWIYWVRGPYPLACLDGLCDLVRARADGTGEVEIVIEGGVDNLSAVWPESWGWD